MEKSGIGFRCRTPAISDPGFLLIRECVKNQIQIECFQDLQR